MFTGLVEETGEILKVEEGPFLRVHIAARKVLEDLKEGDSVAVDGVCLTAVRVDGEGFWVELARETLRRTAPTWRVGHRPNLERALRVGDRLGGHFVTGHVDGVARLWEVREAPGAKDFYFLPPQGARPLHRRKGERGPKRGFPHGGGACRGGLLGHPHSPHPRGDQPGGA